MIRPVFLAAALLCLASPALASPASREEGPTCTPLPSPASTPWRTGERLAYDVDVMGALAGSFSMVALPPVGVGTSKEHVFRALASSNSFFSKVRRVRGRSTSYVRSRDMQPRRYEEMTDEGGRRLSAEVVFPRGSDGGLVLLDWSRDRHQGRRRFEAKGEAFDPLSAAYFLRTIALRPGLEICFESYGIRRLWRVEGEVVGLEEVRVPAGVYQAWHVRGKATRTDDPSSSRELHLWISNDEARLPVAALGVIDLGAVRAQLTHVGVGEDEREAGILADLDQRPAAPPSPPPARPRPRVR